MHHASREQFLLEYVYTSQSALNFDFYLIYSAMKPFKVFRSHLLFSRQLFSDDLTVSFLLNWRQFTLPAIFIRQQQKLIFVPPSRCNEPFVNDMSNKLTW